MINLLSPADKKELHAARRNATWIRYVFLVLALLVAVNIILGFTVLFVQGQTRTYESRIASNQQLSNQKYQDTKTKTEAFRKDLATAKAVLESETNYSAVIVNIAQVIPSGCVLGALTLNSQSFNVPQSLNFKCKNTADILRLKTSLEKSPATFDKVNIVSTSNAAGEPTPYPISISMSLILKKPASSSAGGKAGA